MFLVDVINFTFVTGNALNHANFISQFLFSLLGKLDAVALKTYNLTTAVGGKRFKKCVP
jgi:hypothetical protein